MKPGKELDALVEEKVFGREQVSKDYREYERLMTIARGKGGLNEELLKATGLSLSYTGYNGYIQFMPPYSTSIKAAWEVVEKLTEKYAPHFELSLGYKNWHAGFDLDRPFKRVTTVGDTAPHAICLAALKAVGMEV